MASFTVSRRFSPEGVTPRRSRRARCVGSSSRKRPRRGRLWIPARRDSARYSPGSSRRSADRRFRRPRAWSRLTNRALARRARRRRRFSDQLVRGESKRARDPRARLAREVRARAPRFPGDDGAIPNQLRGAGRPGALETATRARARPAAARFRRAFAREVRSDDRSARSRRPGSTHGPKASRSREPAWRWVTRTSRSAARARVSNMATVRYPRPVTPRLLSRARLRGGPRGEIGTPPAAPPRAPLGATRADGLFRRSRANLRVADINQTPGSTTLDFPTREKRRAFGFFLPPVERAFSLKRLDLLADRLTRDGSPFVSPNVERRHRCASGRVARHLAGKRCAHCNTQTTPLWRNGFDGADAVQACERLATTAVHAGPRRMCGASVRASRRRRRDHRAPAEGGAAARAAAELGDVDRAARATLQRALESDGLLTKRAKAAWRRRTPRARAEALDGMGQVGLDARAARTSARTARIFTPGAWTSWTTTPATTAVRALGLAGARRAAPVAFAPWGARARCTTPAGGVLLRRRLAATRRARIARTAHLRERQRRAPLRRVRGGKLAAGVRSRRRRGGVRRAPATRGAVGGDRRRRL